MPPAQLLLPHQMFRMTESYYSALCKVLSADVYQQVLYKALMQWESAHNTWMQAVKNNRLDQARTQATARRLFDACKSAIADYARTHNTAILSKAEVIAAAHHTPSSPSMHTLSPDAAEFRPKGTLPTSTTCDTTTAADDDSYTTSDSTTSIDTAKSQHEETSSWTPPPSEECIENQKFSVWADDGATFFRPAYARLLDESHREERSIKALSASLTPS